MKNFDYQRSVSPRSPPEYVVAVGASAGGIPALKQLLSRFAHDSVSFVALMHLPPNRTSALAEVLRDSTSMVVAPVLDSTNMDANRIYVLPEASELSVRGNILLLAPLAQARPRWTMDGFFGALAQDRGKRAIGVLLSGAGSDGARGLGAIRAAGGLTFVQSPDSAEFDAMPKNARPFAEFCLPPDQLGVQLMRSLSALARNDALTAPRQSSAEG